MGDVNTMTVKQVEKYLEDLQATGLRARDRLLLARKRIHEFAKSTREYELAEVSFTLDEIDAEFYAACANAADPSQIAMRFDVPVDTVLAWGKQSNAAGVSPSVIRLVVERDDVVMSYAMPFRRDRRDKAQQLMGDFKDTLIRKGWSVVFLDAVAAPDPTDTILADA